MRAADPARLCLRSSDLLHDLNLRSKLIVVIFDVCLSGESRLADDFDRAHMTRGLVSGQHGVSKLTGLAQTLSEGVCGTTAKQGQTQNRMSTECMDGLSPAVRALLRTAAAAPAPAPCRVAPLAACAPSVALPSYAPPRLHACPVMRHRMRALRVCAAALCGLTEFLNRFRGRDDPLLFDVLLGGR